MNVQLIAITKPVIPQAQTPGELIAYAARVSNPANQANMATAPNLLQYLTNHDHWSPLEMAHMVLEITTTRDIARQILRHRSFAFQEFSQRYAEVVAPPVLRETRLQDTKNRQNSLANDDSELADWWQQAQADAAAQNTQVYQEALARGIAKEVARAVLPEGTTESTLYMAGSVRSWLHYINVRVDPSTQKEHRDIALACQQIVLCEFPELRGNYAKAA